MSLQLILGNSGAGKSYKLYESIIKASIENPDLNYIIIVPEQFTLQTQKDIVSMHPRHGVMNIDIVSFQRLAYRIFDEVGAEDRIILDDTGKNLIIRKVAAEKENELKVLGSNMRKLGYVSEVKSVISEFMQYNIDIEKLKDIIERTKNRQELNYKLKDIDILYRGFKDYIEGSFTTAEELLIVLSNIIGNSSIIKNSIIAIDGFTGFTPVQSVLLRKLLALCINVYVTVTIDHRENPFKIKSDHELFNMSKKTIGTLIHLADQVGCNVEKSILIKDKVSFRHRKVTELGHLERNLFRYPNFAYDGEINNIQITVCKNPYLELRAIAGEILRLVREDGLRFREIAVVSGDINSYSSYAGKVFDIFNIPAFIDDKKSILMNPFIEFIRSLLKMLEDNFSYESVFRYLRSGLVSLNIETEAENNSEEEVVNKELYIDMLENYCLAFGIRGFKAYSEKWVRTYSQISEEDLVYINSIRESFIGQLTALHSVYNNKESNVRQMTEALYEFITECDTQNRLGAMEKEFENRGELSLAKEYSQIYKIVMELFDRVVELLGNEVVSKKEYREVLEAGFEEAKVGIIPPSMDRVVFGDIERTRLDNIKVLFFAGVNEGIIPKSKASGGIISETERESIIESGIELAPTSRQNSYTQRFYLYLNMTKPSEKLYISYSKTDSEGKTLRPSYLIGALKKLFTGLSIRDVEEELLGIDSVLCSEGGLDYLAYAIRIRRNRQRMDLCEGFNELFHWYYNNEAYSHIVKLLIEAAYFENAESKISKAVAKALYGTTLENSVTRLEKYAACAFAHFLTYGLSLKERAEYDFQAVDMGNILHKSLELFSKKLNKSGYTWDNLSDEDRDSLAEQCVAECITDYGNTVLYSSARNEYIIGRIKRLVKRTVWALQLQITKGKFKPGNYEVSFSMADNLESINIKLSEDEKMKLKGRIDRMDLYEDDENIYVKIIDYKSGNTSFDLVSFYYGLQLQLVIYMNAAMELEAQAKPDKNIIPAGVLYYNIKDPIIDREDIKEDSDLNDKILEKLKMNGLVNSDKEIIRLMDQSMGSKSDIIPVSFNKDGSLSRYSSTASTDNFKLLGRFADKKIKELGSEILDGNVSISPYENNKRTACDYCTFKGICGFDIKTKGYEFRRLKQFKDEEIWEKLLKEENL